VLKHETSTTYQSHNHESIDLKFRYGHYVTRFSNPAKFGKDSFSGGTPMWWYGSLAFFIIIIFVLDTLTQIQPISVNRF